jgi:hypothetical protein
VKIKGDTLAAGLPQDKRQPGLRMVFV